MHQHQGVHPALGDQCGGAHGFAEGCRRAEDTGVMRLHGGDGCFLVRAQRAEETDIQGIARETLVFHQWRDLVLRQQRLHRVPAATGQGDMLGEILRAANDSGFVPHRQAQGLRFIKLGILKRREADQLVGQGLRQLGLFEVDQIRQGDAQGGRHRAVELLWSRRGGFPWLGTFVFIDVRHAKGSRLPMARVMTGWRRSGFMRWRVARNAH